jgi:acyl-lipid omega-6 desaturase (Delta-12 desaturase)
VQAFEPKAGAALVRASKPFAHEDRAKTWRLLAEAALVFACFEALALLAPFVVLQAIGGALAGLTIVRLFIFFHDWQHGAVFKDSRAGAVAMNVIGWMVLSPAPVWRQTHDYHHRNNAKMLGAAIGSYPTVSVPMWREMSPSQRRWYVFARSPFTILFGYFTVFVAGMCISSFLREPRTHWQGPAALLAHLVALVVVGTTFGPVTAVCAVAVPLFVACGLGSYLFYAQHNFPSCELKSREAWNYHHAALQASSMFDMPAPLHWFTGNIGFHHVHHLNHQIPFYRLPEAMAAIPELQSPGRTSWSVSDVRDCLKLKLWDPDRSRLVGWEEVA